MKKNEYLEPIIELIDFDCYDILDGFSQTGSDKWDDDGGFGY